jgi:hypothetical protein
LSGWTAIRLHDTFRSELERLYATPSINLPDYQSDAEYEVAQAEEASTVPATFIAVLAYWGDFKTDEWWLTNYNGSPVAATTRRANKAISAAAHSGATMFYSAGVAAIAHRRYDPLARLLHLSRDARFGAVVQEQWFCEVAERLQSEVDGRGRDASTCDGRDRHGWVFAALRS